MNRNQLKATLLVMVVSTACIIALVWAIATITHGAPKPPQNCNGSGILKVIPPGPYNDLTIVCENGRVYYP